MVRMCGIIRGAGVWRGSKMEILEREQTEIHADENPCAECNPSNRRGWRSDPKGPRTGILKHKMSKYTHLGMPYDIRRLNRGSDGVENGTNFGRIRKKRQLFTPVFRLNRYPFNNLLRERREWNDAFCFRRFISHLNLLPGSGIQSGRACSGQPHRVRVIAGNGMVGCQNAGGQQ